MTTTTSLPTKRQVNAAAKTAYENQLTNAGRVEVRGLAFRTWAAVKDGDAAAALDSFEKLKAARVPARMEYPRHTWAGIPGDPGMNHWPMGHKVKAWEARAARLAPGGVPRWVRVYDSGESGDRYTVVYTGRAAPERSPSRVEYPYRGMSGAPFHPQGVGQYGSTPNQPCDSLGEVKGRWYWPPAIGRKCHLGTRIRFQDLPEDCRECAWQDYAAIWSIPMPVKGQI